jgi:hypothetical protein
MKTTKYAVTIVNLETGEHRCFLTDSNYNAEIRQALGKEMGEIVFINEFQMAPVHPKVKDASSAY